jgi:hypothetical protein
MVVMYLHVSDTSGTQFAREKALKLVTSREFNQDVSQAKRLALIEPVLVTDRGKPTHVLMSIEAYRELSGQRGSIVELLAAEAGAPAFETESLHLELHARTGKR